MPATLYALIMAGGTGSRLWPRSRTTLPKQFLALTGDLTMLQQAQRRLLPLIPPTRTLIATNQSYVEIVARQLPDLPLENILGEPVGRGTAAAIGLTAIHIRRRNPHAIMAILTADHLIKKTETFRQVLRAASHVAGEDWLVTLGIMPGYPETGYGYVERGDMLGMVGEFEGYRVQRFIEKPDRARAEAYLQSGNYAWNSGMFIWKVSRVLDEMAQHMPELYAGLLAIERAIDTPQVGETLASVFPQLPNQTIDYGIMEKAERVAVLPVDLGWNDVGSWSAVYDVLPRDKKNNVVVGRHLSPDTKNSLIYSPQRLVATIGLDDVVIVDTEDVLLVCPRSRSQDVRDLVDLLKSNGESNYLHRAVSHEPLTREQLQQVFETTSSLEKVLLSLLLHAGLRPSSIAALKTDDFDLIQGWVATTDGKRALPNLSRKLVFEWMRERDSLKFAFSDKWGSSEVVKDMLKAIGERVGINLTVEILYETLAHALFDASEEGQVIRNVLGEEAALVRVPLRALFPFSLNDFSGHESDALGERAQNVLNRAAKMLGI
ncbi:MAG: sugar phosphate nucleotidyltransferase [Anaerolineales bacterium]